MKANDKRRDIGGRALRPESLMMGYGYRPELSEGAVKCPIFQTSTFVFQTAEEGKAFFEIAYGLREKGPKENLGLIYSRLNNPDLEILQDRLTLWDGAASCAVFESGMAAITTVVLELVRPGNVVLHSEPLYGGTDYLLRHVLGRFGIESVGFRAGGTLEEIRERVRAAGCADRTAMIFVETPANPTNELVDIEGCAALARELSAGDRGTVLVVDNTFLGPLWQHPLELGADLIVYSATKFLGGHSDVIAGVAMGDAEIMKGVTALRTFLGTMAGPWTGWLLLRSLETLKLRMTCMMKSARSVADFLNDHPKVERVYYPGLLREDDAGFQVYRRQCKGPGSMISFDLVGGEAEAFRFLNALQLIRLAVSLGGTESLAEHPASMTHSDIPPETRVRMGITDKMIRLSVGVEHPEDLVADIAQAFDKV